MGFSPDVNLGSISYNFRDLQACVTAKVTVNQTTLASWLLNYLKELYGAGTINR
jgi:hypothetical protein